MESSSRPHLVLNHHEGIIILTWNSFIAFTSIVGNTTVLISSLMYNAIHLDRVSIILIRNLAVADLGYGLCLAISLVNMITGRNVFGDSLCWTFAILSFLFVGAGSNFLAGLNINKVRVLLFPLQSNVRTLKRGYIAAGVVWASVSAIIAFYVIYARCSGITYSVQFQKQYNFKCWVENPVGFLRFLSILMQICFMAIPVVCVAVTTVWMGCFVKKVSGIQKQTICTLLVVSATFFISLAPAIVHVIISVARGSTGVHTNSWSETLQTIVPLAVSINCAANPFIYCLTIQSFGAFMKMKLSSAVNDVRVFLLLRRRRIRIADLAARVTRNL